MNSINLERNKQNRKINRKDFARMRTQKTKQRRKKKKEPQESTRNKQMIDTWK